MTVFAITVPLSIAWCFHDIPQSSYVNIDIQPTVLDNQHACVEEELSAVWQLVT